MQVPGVGKIAQVVPRCPAGALPGHPPNAPRPPVHPPWPQIEHPPATRLATPGDLASRRRRQLPYGAHSSIFRSTGSRGRIAQGQPWNPQ